MSAAAAAAGPTPAPVAGCCCCGCPKDVMNELSESSAGAATRVPATAAGVSTSAQTSTQSDSTCRQASSAMQQPGVRSRGQRWMVCNTGHAYGVQPLACPIIHHNTQSSPSGAPAATFGLSGPRLLAGPAPAPGRRLPATGAALVGDGATVGKASPRENFSGSSAAGKERPTAQQAGKLPWQLAHLPCVIIFP